MDGITFDVRRGVRRGGIVGAFPVAASEQRAPVSLRRLFPYCSFVGCADVLVTSATERSDDCQPGCLFAAIRGTRVNGADYIADAYKRGATAILVQQPIADAPLPQCVVPNVRRGYAELCAAIEGNPSRRLKIAAVTGTNGKTTTTWLIRSILAAAGRRTGVLGSIEYNDGRESIRSGMTTPDSRTLSTWLGRMMRAGATHAALEYSSHALDQDRVAGHEIDVAIVTNITQDHFDYHIDADSYLASKARILRHCRPGALVLLNSDDPGSRSIGSLASSSLVVKTAGFGRDADISAEILSESLGGTHFLLLAEGQSVEVHTPLIGRHNVWNCLAAAGTALHFGISLDAIAAGIAAMPCVPGRLESIDVGQSFHAFVDYAHTPDALGRTIECLQSMTPGRVICVFGAGGNRDRLKRPLLGRAASLADLAVVTSDNPRRENPREIIQDILPGFEASAHPPHVEVDRSAAIAWALEQAEPGDCVAVVGKGHETVQIFGDKEFPFDDREVIRRHLAALTPWIRQHAAVPA